MLFHMVTGFSLHSAEDAVAEAVGSALGFVKESRHIQVVVVSVTKAGEGWQATVQVTAEPEEDEREQEPEDAYDQEKEAGQGGVPVDEAPDSPLLHIYKQRGDTEMFERLHDLLDQHYELFIHEIEPGPLWDATLEHVPDADLYQAAHETGSIGISGGAGGWSVQFNEHAVLSARPRA